MEILALLSGLINVGTGIWQAFKSDELADQEGPEYKAPKEADQALAIAKNMAYSDMPGYGQAVSNIQQSEASAMSRAKEVAQSGSDVLGFASGQNLATNRAYAGLDAANEQYKVNAMRNLQQALGIRAGYSDKEFDVNQMQPYLSAQQASSVLGEGAIQNIAGGVNASLTNYLGYKQTDDLLDRLYGPTNKTSQNKNQDPENNWYNSLLQKAYFDANKYANQDFDLMNQMNING